MDLEEKRALAWIGDAVLALYAREWILVQSDIAVKVRAQVFQSITSNEFLSHIGEPTAVECEIGIIFKKNGLQAAMDYIESTLMPLFIKKRKLSKLPGRFNSKKAKA